MNNDVADWRDGRPLRAIITGAGSGTGEQFARYLSGRGVALLLCDRDEVALAKLRSELQATCIPCDILDEACVERLFETADERFGHVDLLINAAGSDYVRTLGVMRSSREFARRPRTALSYIVNIASGARTGMETVTYAGSEVGFSRLADGLARAIGTDHLKLLTIDRFDSVAALSDLAERLLDELRPDRDRGSKDGAARRAAGI